MLNINFFVKQYKMDIHRNKATFNLQIKSSTWLKDSHSLFDYQSQKIDTCTFSFPINTTAVSIYRKRQASTVVAIDENNQHIYKVDQEEFQFLTRFELKTNNSLQKLRLEFDKQKVPNLKKISSQRLNTDQSNSAIQNKEEDTYFVLRKNKDINNQHQGFKLMPGQTIKLGRVQYFVSQLKQSQVVTKATKNILNNFNNKVLKVTSDISTQQSGEAKNACKICLDEIQTAQNFLFNPCLCTGSCGSVHIQCLTKWIHVKVKKQTTGGTTHFNFNKFQCQVCKFELPMIIEYNGGQRQLLPLQKPQGNYLVLEGACQKTKSVMVIQNLPAEGIKLGRGHQCQIRITDISVSRSHAFIKNIGNSFYLHDNKSKFGTLVRTQPMVIQLGKLPKAIQIGRTVLNFSLQKDYPKQIRPQFPLKQKHNQ